MAIPPISPLKIEGVNINYFDKLLEIAGEYLKEDGIILNFEGYNETLNDYMNLKENDVEKAWILTKELNSWSEYFSSIANLIQKMYLDSETDKIEIQAIASIEADATKVANGERLSNKDAKVVKARKKRNALKALYDELESKIKFLERAYYHCKSTCEWANKSSNYSNSNQSSY